MGVVSDFAEFMTVQGQLERYEEKDEYGNESYGDSEDVMMYTEVELSRGGSGSNTSVDGRLLVTGGLIVTEPMGIKPKDRITFTDPNSDTEVVAYANTVRSYIDPETQEPYHQEVNFNQED